MCVHHNEDDVYEILKRMVAADVIAFATPNYLESMTGQMKTLLDRTLPLVQPYIESLNGESRHPLRKLKEGMRFVLVSVCGHHEVSNFSALVHTFERVARNLHGELVARILRPHAMLLKRPGRKGTKYYHVMSALESAGQQLVLKGFVKKEIERQIQMELIPKDSFIQQTNYVWDKAIEKGKYLSLPQIPSGHEDQS